MDLPISRIDKGIRFMLKRQFRLNKQAVVSAASGLEALLTHIIKLGISESEKESKTKENETKDGKKKVKRLQPVHIGRAIQRESSLSQFAVKTGMVINHGGTGVCVHTRTY
jgi:hypothetical protein